MTPSLQAAREIGCWCLSDSIKNFDYRNDSYSYSYNSRLIFIYSLDETLWNSVRNIGVPCFFYLFQVSIRVLDLYACVAQEHLSSNALPDTTAIRRKSNTLPLLWKTHALPIAPQPFPVIVIHVVNYTGLLNFTIDKYFYHISIHSHI